MSIGYSGNPRAGYEVAKLSESIGNLLDPPEPQNVAIIGIGNLGRAIMAYFHGRRPKAEDCRRIRTSTRTKRDA